MQRIGLDQLDMQIIHALQIDPRMPWTALAPVIGSDPVTLARRWRRIQGEGFAWISAVMGGRSPGVVALSEFSCEPGRVAEVAGLAAQDPAISSIDLTAGRRDFIATLVVSSDAELAEYAVDRLGRLPGVREVRTHIINEVMHYGSDWSVQALSLQQIAILPRPRRPRRGAAQQIEPRLEIELRRLLNDDGRATNAELSASLGISAQRVADAIARLREDRKLVLRTDVAHAHSNWPVVVWFFIAAPAATVLEAGRRLTDMPQLQFAATVTGPSSLIVAMVVETKADIMPVEAELERRLPRSRIVDRSIVVRVYKHLGRLLGPGGRAIHPYESWADAPATP